MSETTLSQSDGTTASGRLAAAPAAKGLRLYVVTIEPTMKVYAGAWSSGPYTVEITARDRSEAIRKARRQRRHDEGALAVPVTYRARLQESER
jgi:hypothetical protein